MTTPTTFESGPGPATVLETQGVSPKASAASLVMALGTLATVLVLWLVTGDFDKAELTAALTGFIGAGATFAAAYLAKPGDVRPVARTPEGP